MSILITGGTGKIGLGLAQGLIDKKEDVVLFDIAPREERLADLKGKVKVVRGDIKVWPEVMNVVKDNGVKGIIHLAGMLSLPSEDNPWAAFQTNIEGSMYILEAARLFGVERVLFASTAATYGLGIHSKIVNEDTLQRPTTMYGTTKLTVELLGRFYRRKFGLDFRCIRYFRVLFPGERVRTVSSFLPWMIEYPALGKPVECFVSEDVVWPFTYRKDAVRATLMLYHAPKENIKTVCYNICGVTPMPSLKDVEMTVKKLIPDAQITYKPDPFVMDFYRTRNIEAADDSRAREEWGWRPSNVPLEEIVADFIEEARRQARESGS